MTIRNAACAFIFFTVFLAPVLAAQQPDAVTHAQQIRDQGDFGRAIQLLRAHLANAPGDTRAELILAEALYWHGDFSAAARHFRNVLRADPGNAAARRQLDEIRAVSATTVTLRADRTTDNQPMDRAHVHSELGVFITPLWSLRVQANPLRANSGSATLETLPATLGLRGYLPRARVDLELRTGAVVWAAEDRRLDTASVELIGAGRIALRAASGLTVAASVERAQYTATIASLTAPLMTTTPRATARFDRAGWIGEAATQLEQYPDDNSITTVYGWLLAPLLRSRAALLQAGFAASFQDAQESRLMARGVYDPYFTPEQEVQGGVAASVMTWTQKGVRLQLNGSYALYGRKGPANAREEFTPYSAHGALTVPLGANATFTADAERVSTSFYHQTRVGASIFFRFAPRPTT